MPAFRMPERSGKLPSFSRRGWMDNWWCLGLKSRSRVRTTLFAGPAPSQQTLMVPYPVGWRSTAMPTGGKASRCTGTFASQRRFRRTAGTLTYPLQRGPADGYPGPGPDEARPRPGSAGRTSRPRPSGSSATAGARCKLMVLAVVEPERQPVMTRRSRTGGSYRASSHTTAPFWRSGRTKTRLAP